MRKIAKNLSDNFVIIDFNEKTMIFNTLRARLVSHTPSLLKLPIKLMPANLQKAFMLQVLQKVFHESLADGDFEFLEDKWLEIYVRDIDFKSYISFDKQKLIVESQLDKEADVKFSANLNDLVLIAARKEDPDTLFFQRRLLIEGDTELGLEVKNLMDSIDLDTLPKLMKQGLFSLANFVQQGLKDSEQQKGVTERDYAKQS